MLKERERVQEDRLRAASFTAWQLLPAQGCKTPKWETYISRMGLAKLKPNTEEDLKEAEKRAMSNVEKILKKARAHADIRG